MFKRKVFNLVEYDKYPQEINELYSKTKLKFAFIGENNNQLHQPTFCRDILTSVLWGSYYKEKVRQCYFVYDYEENPLDIKNTALSLYYTDISKSKKEISCLKRNIKYLNNLEKFFNIEPTNLYKTQDNNTLVVKGDKGWQTTNWKISLYAFLLRYYSEEQSVSSRDKELMDWLLTSEYYYNNNNRINYLLTNFNNCTWDGDEALYNHTGSHGFQGFLEAFNSSNRGEIKSTFVMPNEDKQCVV